jgi:hypothetical protein
VPAVVLGGIGTITVVLLWIRLFPELFRVDRLKVADDEIAEAARGSAE